MTTHAQLIILLGNAVSLDHDIRINALDVLTRLETESMYFKAIQEIYMDRNIELRVRTLAVICLKNGIGKYWRKSARNAISEAEKLGIRKNQFCNLDEQSKQLSIHQAVITSKIARFDFPNEWPDLLDTLVSKIEASFKNSGQGCSRSLRYNLLFTLHLVMKVLTTKTLPSARQYVQSIAPHVLKFLSPLFYSQLDAAFNGGNDDTTHEHLSIARLALKTIRHLIVYGYSSFDGIDDVTVLYRANQNILTNLHLYLPKLVQHSTASNQLKKTVESFLITIGKIYVDLSQEKIIDFVILPCFANIVHSYWSLLESDALAASDLVFADKIKIQCIKILKNLVDHRDFNVISINDLDPRAGKALEIIKTNLFTPEFIILLSRLLITTLMKLTTEDLDLWAEEPESFVQEEESDHWEYHLRACSQKLFICLITKHKSIVSPFIIQSLLNLQDSDDILLRGSIYDAIAVGCHSLFDYLDFDDWAKYNLSVEVLNKSNDYKIIRRQISILLGHWIGVKCSKENRGVVYMIILNLLQPSEDIVVRLSAVLNLKIIVDDFDFEASGFLDYLQPCIDSLMVLMNDVDDFDSQMRIVDALIVLVERMEDHVVASIAPLIQLLPHLWDRSEGQNMFRTSIVSIIGKLVKALRGESYQLHDIVIPILYASLDTSKAGHVYLLEEGLQLWLVSVQNSRNLSNELVSLIPTAIKLLEYGADSLRTVLHIIESYIIMDPISMLSSHSDLLVQAITKLLCELTVVASNSLLRLIDTTLQSCNYVKCVPNLFQAFIKNGLFQKVVEGVLSDDLGQIVSGFLTVLSRLLLYEPNVVSAAMNNVMLENVIDVCLNKFDLLGHAVQRKLCALGLASLLGTGHPMVAARLSHIIAILTSVGIEVASNENEGYSFLSRLTLFMFEVREGDDDEKSPDYLRRELLHTTDILYNPGSFLAFLRQAFADFEVNIGSNNLNALIATIDSELVSQLRKMLTI